MVTKEEWVDWRNSRVTQEYLKALTDKREMLKEGIAEGQTDSDRADHIVIGRTQGLKDAIIYAVRDFDYVQLEDTNVAESGSV